MKNPIDLLNQFPCYRVHLFSTFTQDSEKLKVKNVLRKWKTKSEKWKIQLPLYGEKLSLIVVIIGEKRRIFILISVNF